jgi:hypothetical protein
MSGAKVFFSMVRRVSMGIAISYSSYSQIAVGRQLLSYAGVGAPEGVPLRYRPPRLGLGVYGCYIVFWEKVFSLKTGPRFDFTRFESRMPQKIHTSDIYMSTASKPNIYEHSQ